VEGLWSSGCKKRGHQLFVNVYSKGGGRKPCWIVFFGVSSVLRGKAF